MSFTLCRFKKITSIGGLVASDIHNGRKYEEMGLQTPPNIIPFDPNVRPKYGYNQYEIWMEGKDIIEAVESRFKKLNIKPRSNSVLAHEYVLGVSNDWYQKAKYSASGMLSNLMQFVVEKYAEDNIVSVAFHYDESNPHVHVVCLPIVKKIHHWKNSNGSGKTEKYSLSGHHFIDKKDSLVKLQDDFHKHASKWDQFDAKLHRGLKAEFQKKEYTKKTDHILGRMRNLELKIEHVIKELSENKKIDENLIDLKNYKEKKKDLEEKLSNDQSEIDKLEKKIKYRKGKNENGGWKKGIDF